MERRKKKRKEKKRKEKNRWHSIIKSLKYPEGFSFLKLTEVYSFFFFLDRLKEQRNTHIAAV